MSQPPPAPFEISTVTKSDSRPTSKTYRLKESWWQTLLIVLIATCLFWDRYNLCQSFLFKYSDEDQTLLWYAAAQTLKGHLPEPCFYGQAYNSTFEGILAAPLVLLCVPPWIALPLVTVALGLWPYLLLAAIAYAKKRYWLAGLAILTPLLLPIRYAMLTGIPRGWVPGIALAIISCVLLIDRQPSAPQTTRIKPRFKFIWAALLAVIAVTLNPNCAILLAAAMVYALATYWKQARFWIFSATGLLIGSLHPLWVYLFYYRWHEDYRFYRRDTTYAWTQNSFFSYFRYADVPLGDVVPALGIPTSYTILLLAIAAAVFAIAAFILRRGPIALALLGGVALLLISFANAHTHDGRTSVFYGFGRMYLAVPVLLLWTLSLWQSDSTRPAGQWSKWAVSIVLILAFATAFFSTFQRSKELPSEVRLATQNVPMVQLIDVAQARAFASQIQSAADQSDADLVLLPREQYKRWTYLLPVLTNCETLLPHYDRRTWRLKEESTPRHDRILVTEAMAFNSAVRNGYGNAAVISQNPFVGVFDSQGKSTIQISRELGLTVRTFRKP